MAIKSLVVTRFRLEPLDPLESLNRVLREFGVARAPARRRFPGGNPQCSVEYMDSAIVLQR
jgi:hypothetical protein